MLLCNGKNEGKEARGPIELGDEFWSDWHPMTFPTSSPSRRQSMNVVYVYTEGCSHSMRSICCLSTRSLTSPLHCVREKKERLHETCEFCDFRCNDIKLSRAKTQMRVHMRCKYKCDVLTKARSLQTYGLRSSGPIQQWSEGFEKVNLGQSSRPKS